MKICWFGFLGKNHSWSIVGQNISRELIRMGHHVDLFSTNGTQHFPEDLKPYLKAHLEEGQAVLPDKFEELVGSKLDRQYDMQLSYTALKNFHHYFIRGDKNRFGIWNYETTILPTAFAKYHQHVDKVLPSSTFSKQIFTSNGIPESKQVVIPHGIHLDRFMNLGVYPLKTKKRCKILANIAQPHIRKNIPGLLKAYGKAFTRNDDVCLVIKISKRNVKNEFEINFDEALKQFKTTFKNHGEIEIIDRFIVDIETLYNACDAVITMAHSECFWMPGLEAFAANKVVIAPRYGGQLDYMNDENSILIGGREVRADTRMQYWESSPYAKAFEPNVDECAGKLKELVANYDGYFQKFSPKMQEIVPEYTWTKVAQRILDLCV